MRMSMPLKAFFSFSLFSYEEVTEVDTIENAIKPYTLN